MNVIKAFTICILARLTRGNAPLFSYDSESATSPTKIAFGSCNKPEFPQVIWPAVNKFHPDVWLWVGDAFYLYREHSTKIKNELKAKLGRSPTKEELFEAITGDILRVVHQAPGYDALATYARVEGVYDDHDYGLNDGGKSFGSSMQRIAQTAYLNFLFNHSRSNEVGVSDNNNHDDNHNLAKEKQQIRYSRDGLHSSHWFGGKGNENEEGDGVQITLLDTRSHRDDHIVPSLGSSPIPLGAKIALVLRWFSALSGLTTYHEGDVLGEEQWKWLEASMQAAASNHAKIHIIVSSIQVFTSNALVESWGHFPHSQRRLNALLEKYRQNPRTILVSGDVHFAEFLGVKRSTSSSSSSSEKKVMEVMEVTSSGLTHTCVRSRLWAPLCTVFMKAFDSHRPKSLEFYTELNFGTFELERKSKGSGRCSTDNDGNGDGCQSGNKEDGTISRVVVSIRNEAGEVVLQEKIELSEKCIGEDCALTYPEGLQGYEVYFWVIFVLVMMMGILVLALLRKRYCSRVSHRKTK